MKRRFLFRVFLISLSFGVFIFSGVSVSLAQQPTSTPVSIVSTPALPTSDDYSALDRKIFELQQEQSKTVKALEVTNERNATIFSTINTLFTITSGLFAALVLFQSALTVVQQRRESRREGREKERDSAELIGVQRVNQIMAVVRNSEAIRLQQAEEEQKKTAIAVKESEDLKKQIVEFNAFMEGQKAIRETRWKSIKDRASEWSEVRTRKDFASISSELRKFADEFDQFDSYFRTGYDDDSVFNPNAHYIRGVAAHYANDPENVQKHLLTVVGRPQPEKDENEVLFKKRKANAYYYLGLTESNFGNFEQAIGYFKEGHDFELNEYDPLTKVVIAEAYVFDEAFEKADSLLNEAIDKFDSMEQAHGQFEPHQLRRRSRAVLIKANIHIIRGEHNWQKSVQELLEPLHEKDPLFFYAIATLAQSYYSQKDKDKAVELFREADERIQETINSQQAPEVRSKILFWMTAAMAANQISGKNRANGYLGNASGLIDALPKIKNQKCTVFSPLSKKNEQVDEIKKHIVYIREGMVLLNHDKDM